MRALSRKRRDRSHVYPHPRLGEEPAAFVIVRAGATVSDEVVGDFMRDEGVAPQKIPRIVVTVDELPRTASGKVKKYELVELLPAPSVR